MHIKSVSVKLLLPFLLLLTTSIILTMPHSFLSYGAFTPLYSLATVYYWYLLFPTTMPVITLLIFGFIQDMLFGMPLGFSSASLILLRLFIGCYKNFLTKKSFNVLWLGFALCSLYIILLQFLILTLFLSYSLTEIWPLVQQWYFTCLLYPSMHYIFDIIAHKCKMLQINNAQRQIT